ncbi:MAG: class I SAM-dependent methyltransferase [Pseudomonadota bacterium]
MAIADGLVDLSSAGRLCVLGAWSECILNGLPVTRLHIVQKSFPVVESLRRRGVAVDVKPDGPYVAALVQLPRAKAEARTLIAEAWAVTRPMGLICIDGQKTDGIDSMLRNLRSRRCKLETMSKFHGKLIWFFRQDEPVFDDWTMLAHDPPCGFVTAPGVFSAESIDAGSERLALHLPELAGRVIDLGAGWGYLSRQILRSAAVTSLDLVEADHVALDCARQNVADPRAVFHWSDARTIHLPAADVIVSNPPFHTGRAAEPAMGAAFIASAARLLKPSGAFWMVANRHLPYEKPLGAAFATVTGVMDDGRFKIIRATHPRRARF